MASPVDTRRHLIGLISDTHGRLDPRVMRAFAGVERILHAGDVGHPEVIWELQTIAPVVAVCGNVDRCEVPGEELPPLARLEIGGVRITVVHQRRDVPAWLQDESDVIVFGHSHMPLIEELDGTLWANPGSASQARRSQIGRSVALLDVSHGLASARVVALNDFGEQ